MISSTDDRVIQNIIQYICREKEKLRQRGGRGGAPPLAWVGTSEAGGCLATHEGTRLPRGAASHPEGLARLASWSNHSPIFLTHEESQSRLKVRGGDDKLCTISLIEPSDRVVFLLRHCVFDTSSMSV